MNDVDELRRDARLTDVDVVYMPNVAQTMLVRVVRLQDAMNNFTFRH